MSDRFDHTLDRKLERKPDEVDDAVVDVRRLEVISGTGRRRRWSTDEKARILVESFAPGASVSDVARRNGLTPQQLFGWRRDVRDFEQSAGASVAPVAAPNPHCKQRPAADRVEAPMSFAPIVVAAPTTPPCPPPPSGPSTPGVIEIVIGDMVVRVIGEIEPAKLVAVLRAVRRSA